MRRLPINALGSNMYAENRLAPNTALIYKQEQRPRKLIQLYSKEVKCPLYKFTTDEAFVEFDASSLRYIHLSGMTAQQYAADIITKFCKVTDAYNESMPNAVSVEVVGTLF